MTPHDRQPQIGVPLRLGVFFRLRDAEQIAGAGDDDEEVVAQNDEPRRDVASETGTACALHDIEREVATKTLPPNAKMTAEVCSGRNRPNVIHGRSKFSAGNASSSARPDTDQKSDNSPEHGNDGSQI